ncbi:MAG: hypothetical protein U0900_09510 [Myxococcota bacterium]
MRSLPLRPIRSSLLLAALCLGLAACSPQGTGGASSPANSSGTTPVPPAGPLDAAAMKQAVSEALVLPDTLDRISAICELMKRVDASNVEGARDAYDAAVEGLDREEVRVFANAWARIDARAALEWFTRWRAPMVGQSAISEVVHYWTRHGGADEARAFALASLGPEGPESGTVRNLIVDATAAGLASAARNEELTRLLEDLPSGQERSWVITQAMIEFYRSGVPKLRAWVDSIPWEAKNDLKRDALRSALVSLAHYDPAATFAWYEEVEPKLALGAYLDGIAEAAGAREPLATIEWLRARKDSAGRHLGLRAAAYHFLKSDVRTARAPGAGAEAGAGDGTAAEWIRTHLDDPAIDAAMRFPLTQYLISVDLQQALPLAEKIEAPGEKVAALKQILAMWSRKDYPAVERYMAEVGVPQEVEQAVRGLQAIRQQQREAKKAASGGAGS